MPSQSKKRFSMFYIFAFDYKDVIDPLVLWQTVSECAGGLVKQPPAGGSVPF